MRFKVKTIMNIALLHYSFWPEVGGVENVMRDQANMLRRAGHSVKVIVGSGLETGDDFELVVLPELAPEFELNVLVRTVLERGQADLNFNKYRSVLVEALGAALTGIDVALVHNVFTMHFNLVFTMALHDLSPYHKMVAWTHDLAATNTDYAVPNPTKPPWNLMRTSASAVDYVAVSGQRADELKVHLKPAVDATLIPDMVDPARLFGLTPEIRESLPSLSIHDRDLVLLLPAKVMLRKNIEFAIEVLKTLCDMGRNPLLLITGAKVLNSDASARYGDFLRQSLPKPLLSHVVFISDFFAIQDDTMRDLYLLSDCLLFPSKQEGFGLPVVEAGLHRLPVWCQKIPAFFATEGEGCYLLEEIAQVPEAVAWLESLPMFRKQRRCRLSFDPNLVYRQHYETFLAAYTPK